MWYRTRWRAHARSVYASSQPRKTRWSVLAYARGPANLSMLAASKTGSTARSRSNSTISCCPTISQSLNAKFVRLHSLKRWLWKKGTSYRWSQLKNKKNLTSCWRPWTTNKTTKNNEICIWYSQTREQLWKWDEAINVKCVLTTSRFHEPTPKSGSRITSFISKTSNQSSEHWSNSRNSSTLRTAWCCSTDEFV